MKHFENTQSKLKGSNANKSRHDSEERLKKLQENFRLHNAAMVIAESLR